jgi:hypothetical protein
VSLLDGATAALLGSVVPAVPLTKVAPTVVEVAADAASEAGRWRHRLRFARRRPDPWLNW